MRVVKLYEDFIDTDKSIKSVKVEKIRQDLEDIFVELRDVKYSVKVNALQYDITPNTHYEVILVRNSGIDFDELEEYVMMLIDYMKIKYNVKKIAYDVCLGDFTTNWGDTITNSYDEFPDKVGDLDTNEFGINFEVPDYEINEGFGDFVGPDFNKIESDVNDMFIDLKDNGAKITIGFYHTGSGYGVGKDDNMIKVRIYSDRKFSMSDVEEPTRMMVDYFKDLTDRRIDMEYQRASDYTNTRQSKFNPYSFDNEVTIYLIERG